MPAANDAADAVPRSLDLAEAQGSVDVEKFFPEAMAHLKASPRATHLKEAAEARWWSDETHAVNADGFRPPEKPSLDEIEGREHSFFNEGSLDIRGGMREANAPTRAEALSPDILQLSGGKARLHGMSLAERSNEAPADLTIEEDAAERGFGDTPLQITDMLRERLMELKAEKLKEDRETTFMPRRLRLQSDAEVARRQQAAAAHKDLLRLAQKSEGHTGRRSTTLADWSDAPVQKETEKSAILRDGVSAARREDAARILTEADNLVPGGTVRDTLFGSAGRSGLSGTSRESTERDGVYLLRVLPRASFCSRRESTAIIASGQVKVNNVVERNPFRVIRAEDDVVVAGHEGRLRFAPPRLWIYHKPANVIVSRNDVAGRTLISKHARILGLDHLIPVGSLPMKTHGILLLTNDGELSRFLENPISNMQQTYMLRVRPAVDPVLAHKLNTQGININGQQYRGVEFMVNPAVKSRHSLKVKLRGQTLPVAHIMQHLGRTVERGGRIAYGPFSLNTLPVGSIREVTVPPKYSLQLGAVWTPFVERDWPYFRRQRVSRLRKLCRYRELTPRELEELDHYTYEEVKGAITLETQELSAAAEERAALMGSRQPALGDADRPSYFPGMGRVAGGTSDILTHVKLANDDVIMEDITRAF